MSQRTSVVVLASVAFCVLSFVSSVTKLSAQTATAKPADAQAQPVAPVDASKVTPESKEIGDAVKLFQSRDFDGANRLLQKAVKKYPDMPPAPIIMAQLYSQVGSLVAVRSALEDAVAEVPNDPEAYIIMGDLAARDRRFTEARMLYTKAEEMVPKFQGSQKRKDMFEPRILSGLASIDEAQEKWPEVQKRLEAWQKLEPTNSQPLQRLARCLFMQKNATGALEKLKEAAKNTPDFVTPEAILAQLYEQADDRANAKKWMAEALRLAPKDLHTHLVVGQWALQTGQLKDAKTQAAEALKLDPQSLDALILSGIVAMFQKDYPTAERFFETAHVQAPRNFAAANNLALVLVDQKDEAKRRRALEYAQSNIQANSRSTEAASTYGWVLYKLGRFDEAEKALNVAISGGSAGPDTAYYIACLAYDRGRESQAKEWLDIALKSSAPFAMRQEAEELMAKLKK
jgi:tetratricopeptide (TPR) repeat protein